MTTPAPLTILARVLLLLASVGAGFGAATREYSIGLDFQGGAFVELAVQQVPPEHGLEAARELLAELEMSGSLRLSGDHVSLQLDGADEADTGGRISIDLGSDATLADAERLARQLRAAAFGLEIERSDVIHPVHAPALGRPMPVVLGILGGLAWMFVLLRPRTPWPSLVAAAMATTGAVVEVYSLSLGTTLTAAMHLAMFALALAVGVAVTIGEQRGSRLTIGGRLLAAWPGLIGFVGVFTLGLLAAGSPGFWRGVSHTLLAGFGPAVLLAVLGVVALAATDSRDGLQSLELDQMRDGSR
jgi:hypothetical protein